ncbi:MAG: DNA gyrase subunit A [Planctomycetes bacterium]|nr:DNA gyrase subunit A [Planctomycetota bacterium]
MKDAYLTFSMSVIVSRALPDVRDGLKPSQRRILVAMHDLNLGPTAKHRKCAKVCGDTSGNYHPHGQEVVYPTLARMAQDFNYRYPLVDGQGNFGSMDGDPPGAMRYTECRMARPSMEMMEDLEKRTVDFVPNYEGTLEEPTVLPGKFPNLLVNGCTGIAVGMATSIPPHNLNEICDGIMHIIDHPDCPIEELLKIIPGPDFPTGGLICGRSGIVQGYKTGRGTLTLRARAHVETTPSGKKSIVITEVPYLTNRDKALERLGELVRTGKIEGITDIRNESDRDGCRLVIDLRRDADENVVLNLLYKHTTLQSTVSLIMIALVNQRPITLNLKQMLAAYRDHRADVIVRRTRYLLEQAEARAHILEGLLTALKHIDEIVEMIKLSQTPEEARNSLMASFGLSEKQANAVLQMRLQRLTGLEQEKIEKEYGEVQDEIREYKEILGSPQRVLDIIRDDLQEMKDRYGDDRRTEIVGAVEDIDIEDLIAEEDVIVTITHQGYVKRLPVYTYRAQGRGGKGVSGGDIKEGDFIEHLFLASTHDYILFFTTRGKLYWLKVYDVPEAGRTAKGRALVNVLTMGKDEAVTSMIPVRHFDERQLVMVTKKGMIKKTRLTQFGRPTKAGIIAMKLPEEDALVDVRITSGDHELVVASSSGKAIRFHENDVRSMGRNAYGVRAMRLKADDEVVGMVVADENADLLTLCQNGYGKRTSLSDYRTQSRGGQGVIDIKTTERNGPVVGVRSVAEGDHIVIITSEGMVVRTRIADIRQIGRNTQGVRIVTLNAGDHIVAMTRIITEEEQEDVAKGDDKKGKAEQEKAEAPTEDQEEPEGEAEGETEEKETGEE